MKRGILAVSAAVFTSTAALYVILLLLGGTNPSVYSPALAGPLELAVTAVYPSSSPNDLDTTILITGTDFSEAASAALGDQSLDQVTWLSDGLLEAVVPWGLDPGVYTLTVENPGGGEANLADAFTVTQAMNQWTTGGPYGGEIWNVSLHPITSTQVYAAAQYSGLFFSDDAAEQWQPMLLASPVHRAGVSFDAEGDQVLYFAFMGGQAVMRSQDGGASWDQILAPTPYLQEFLLAAHPITSGVVYAAASASMSDAIDPTEDGGIFRSTDFGDTWNEITTGLTDTHVTTLAFHPEQPSTMLAGTRGGNIFTSTNGGDNWYWAAQPADHIEGLFFNPNGAHEAWAVTASPVSEFDPPYLFTSTAANLGTWLPAGNFKTYSLAFHPTISNTLWASGGSGYVSTDGGDNWEELDNGPPGGVMDLDVDPNNPAVLYAGTRHFGLYQSSDSGVTWMGSNYGLAGVVPDHLALSPDDPYQIYGYAQSMGMLKSSDGGSSWSSLDLRRKVGGGSQDPLAVDPFTTTRVYLGDSWFIDEPRTAPSVWVSENGGGDWRVVTMTVPSAPAGWSAETLAVAPHPANPGQILAGVNVFPTDEPGFGSGGIFASTDYGEHWKELEFSQPISAVTGIVYAPSNPDTIYAGTGGAGLLKSIDGGQDWEVITSGQWSEGVISAIAVHPENADEIYLSEKGTVYFSEDGGETWASMGSPAWIGLLLFAPNNPSILYAAGNGGLFRSKDRGVWQPVAGIPNQADVLSIAAGMDGERVVFYIGSSSGTLPVEQRLAGRLGSEAIKNPGLGSIMSGGVYRKTSLAHLMYLPLAPQSINK